MRVLLTGHKGYIGAVAGPILISAGHAVVGLDTDLFAGCDFGAACSEIPEIHKDVRDLTAADLESLAEGKLVPEGPRLARVFHFRERLSPLTEAAVYNVLKRMFGIHGIESRA